MLVRFFIGNFTTPVLHKIFQIIKKKRKGTLNKSIYKAKMTLMSKPDKNNINEEN